MLVAHHRQLAAFDVDRRLLQPGARHHTAFRPDGGSLSGATPTLSAQIISPSLCVFFKFIFPRPVCVEVSIYLWWGFLSESVRLRAGCKVREPLRMNPQCARCGKIVYPTEKVSCLDKVSGRTAELLPARCSLSTPAEGERRRRAVNLAEAQVGVKARERERERNGEREKIRKPSCGRSLNATIRSQ